MEIKLTTHDAKDKHFALVSFVKEDNSQVILSETGEKNLIVGVGEKPVNHRKLILAARQIIDLAKKYRIEKLAVKLEDFLIPSVGFSDVQAAQILAENFEIANFEFLEYKSKPRHHWPEITEVMLIHPENQENILKSIKKGQAIGREMNECRNLINTPSSDMTPSLLSQRVHKVFSDTNVNIKILGKKEIQEHKMGGILGVSRGSAEEPKLIIMEHFGADNPEEPPIVLAGKAVTYDTGGLCLKPSLGLLEMHMDMSGGAVVIHALAVAGKLNLKRNIIGLVPAVENILSQHSYRPGDILTMMSGKTVEVLNTDAEGRLILADTLTYAQKYYQPRLLVALATLTGASRVALGLRATALFTKNEHWQQEFRKAGEESGDYVWPLPLWEEYEKEIQGKFGDIVNVPYSASRYGGAIIAATFLTQFVEMEDWVHLDIAPRMTSMEGDCLAEGATGEPLRLLSRLMEKV